jgi:pantoate--beta-alanine ligase
MIIFKQSVDLSAWLETPRKKGLRSGFVPTMGALHAGHLSLIEASKAVADLTICSIFVNPSQFNNPDDFKKYPVSTENDILMLEKQGVDVLFLPEAKEVYPPGEPLEQYELGYLGTVLEGRYRPGHFQGVCQVMSRLLKQIRPDHLFMGQKDFQQCLVVKQLVAQLELPLQFHIVPTVREPDGLAMSSRNSRLNPEQRKRATALFRALTYIKGHLLPGDPAPVLEKAFSILEAAEFETDYICIARTDDLRPVLDWNGKEGIVALAAAFQGEVRLIDNMLLN